MTYLTGVAQDWFEVGLNQEDQGILQDWLSDWNLFVDKLRRYFGLLDPVGEVANMLDNLRMKPSCQAWFTLGWKSAEWTRRWADLWNNLGFSLCAVPSVCRMVATSDE